MNTCVCGQPVFASPDYHSDYITDKGESVKDDAHTKYLAVLLNSAESPALGKRSNIANKRADVASVLDDLLC